MNINSIKINGFKKLVQFSLAPDGKSVELVGDNGEGKSSVIDAVWVALTNKGVPDVPMNRESVRTDIELGLSDGHTVEWSISPKGNKKLTVCGPDGAEVKAPATFLQNLIGSISFDPFDFVTMQPREQKKFLQDLLKLDFSDLEAKKQGHLADKRQADAEATAYEKQLEDLADAVKTEPVDVSAALEEQRQHAAAVAAHAEAVTRLERIRERAETVAAQRKELADRIARDQSETEERITRERAELAQRVADMNAQIDALPNAETIANGIAAAEAAAEAAEKATHDAPDVSEVIEQAGEINRQADRWANRLKLIAALREAQAASAEADRLAKSAESEKESRLMDAKFPVEGLSFSADGVLFKGLPFNQGNQCMSDILRVGVAIAVAQNPALKIVRIKDASLLGAKKRAELLATLREYGFQAFVERVTEGPLKAIIIEEEPEA